MQIRAKQRVKVNIVQLHLKLPLVLGEYCHRSEPQVDIIFVDLNGG